MEPEPKEDNGFATISVKKGTKALILKDKLDSQTRFGREMDYDELMAFMSEVFREMPWLHKREIFGRMKRREGI